MFQIINKVTKLAFMKKLFALLLFCVGIQVGLYAQPSFQLDSGTGMYVNSEEFCITVNTQDFTDILVMQYAINFDPEALNFLNVQNFNLPGLGVDDFDITTAADGFINLSWEDPDGMGTTLDDRSGLFDICFETGDNCGSSSTVRINSASVFITRPNASTRNIGVDFPNMTEAEISVAGVPVTLSAAEIIPCPEEFFCLPVTADFFERVSSFQYTMEWDTSVVSFVSLEPNLDFPSMGPSLFNTNDSDQGLLTVSWSTFEENGITVDPFTTMYDICFQVKGVSNAVTPIRFTNAITPIEISTAAEGASPCAELNDGRARVCSEDGAITAKTSTEVVDIGDAVCVDVTVNALGIQAIDDLRFTLAWDADTLRFDSIRNISLPGLTIDDFDLSAAANGAIIVDWTNADGVGLPQERRIFEACFTAIGPGGSSSQVAFRPNPVPPFVSTTLSGDNDAGLNIRSGSVFIRPPESLNLSVTNATPGPGERVCVDILADDFKEIIQLQTSMSWETRLIEFVGIENIAVPGMSLADFDVGDAANGILVLRWSSANFSGETLEDGERVFSLCFQVRDDAPLGQCAPVFFTDFPAVLEAFSTNSNNLPLNVTSQGNELCVFNEEGLSVQVSNGFSAEPDSTVCVPIVVNNFTDLTHVQFSINWNPSNFRFEDIIETAVLPSAAVLDVSQADLGIITVNWDATTSSATLENGTSILELCLQAVGERLNCTRVDITSSPVPLEVFSATGEGVNLSLNPLHGIVCIDDALFIDEAILNGPSCAANADGSIELVVSGGSGEYDVFWNSTPPQFSTIANQLTAGEHCVTITDGTGLAIDNCYTLEPINPTPVADAGMDSNISCNGNSVTLDGAGSTVGEGTMYNWTVLGDDAATVFSGTQQSAFAFVMSGDSIEFQLQVQDSASMCLALDTVLVTRTENPFIDAGPDLTFTCNEEELIIDASNTEQNANTTFLWTTTDGEFQDSTFTTLNPVITQGGTYILRLEHSGGCIVQDTVVVSDIRNEDELVADAGGNQLFDCNTQSLTVGDSLTTTGNNILLEWTGDGLIREGTENLQFAEVFNPGEYVLVVTDLVSSCTATDTVTVSPNENTPIVTPGFIDFLSCRTTEVALNINVENTVGFTTQWSCVEGCTTLGPLPPPLDTQTNPAVSEAGTYEVIVTDMATGCPMVLSGIVVEEDYTEPVAEAGEIATLGCAPGATVELGVTGSTTEDVTYFWEDASGGTGVFLGAASATPTIISPGMYILTVTNNFTGCTAIDSVQVVPTEDLPEIVLADYPELPCIASAIDIDASASSEGTFEWAIIAGPPGPIDGQGTPIASVDVPGTYRVRLTDADGCVAEQEFEVMQADTNTIELTIDISSQEITCLNPTSVVTVNAEWTGGEGDFSYRFIPRGTWPELPEESEVTLTEAGLYDVEVTENSSMCTRTDLIAIGQDIEVSEIVLDNDTFELTCDGTPVIPDASATVLGGDETVSWTNEAGEELFTILNPEIEEVGIYTLSIINQGNGCVADTTIVVDTASDVEAIIETPELLTCDNPQVILNGFGSTAGDNIVYSWEGPSFFDGQDTETAIVDAAGTYILTVQDTETLCSATAEITVEENTEAPAVDVAETIDLGCETTVSVGGTGTASGDNITYAWTDANGNTIGASAQVEVMGAGIYTLAVTDTDNGCVATASIQVTQNVDLEDANVGSAQTLCDPTATLSANLPVGSTGVWTALNSGIILSENDANTMVDEIQSGENRFIWTLSSADCPDYSSDTLTVFVEAAPNANNDIATLDLTTEESVLVRLIANDNLTATPNWSIALSARPTIGIVDSVENGEVRYSADAAALFDSVEDSFRYTICNTNCPDLCDSALVRIQLTVDPDARFSTYNAITPNGDGLNDELVFELLSVNLDKYPNNELIVFNRWGDIVFSQRGYDNTWGGKSDMGNDLPEGTYYYILRLNLGNGDIIRGDVTIIR